VTGIAEQADDIALLVLRRTGPAGV